MGSSGGIAYERLEEDAELGRSFHDPSTFELGELDDDDPGSSGSNDSGSRGNTIRRGMSTGNVKGLGLGLPSLGSSRMGSRIPSRDHLAATSRSREVSPARGNTGRRVKSPMPKSNPFT